MYKADRIWDKTKREIVNIVQHRAKNSLQRKGETGMKKKHILKIGCGMLILALCLWGCAAPAAPEETVPPTTAIPETTAAAQTTVPETMSPQERESVAEFNRMMEDLEALSAYHVAYRFIMSGQGQTLGNQGWTEIWVDGEDYFYLNHKELPDIPAYDYGYLYLDGVTYGYNIVQSEDDIPDTWKVLDEAFRFAAWADVFHQPEQPTRLVEHTREGDKQTITVLRGEETNNGVLYSPMTLTVTAEGERVAALTLSYYMIPVEWERIPENWIYNECTTEFYDDDALTIRSAIDNQTALSQKLPEQLREP